MLQSFVQTIATPSIRPDRANVNHRRKREAIMPHLGQRAPVICPDTPLMLIGREPGPDGGFGRAGPDAPLPRDPNDATLWLPGQGQANACGTLTLAYILRFLLGPRAPTRAEIDDRLRRGNIFTAPLLLVGYARRLGLAARAYNGARLDLLFGLIDRGVPVIVLTDTTPLNLRDTANLHWVAPVAHCAEGVGIYNPHGFQEQLDLASFEAHWRQARIFGLPAWSNFMIAIGPPGTALPRGRLAGPSFVGANLAAGGIAGVVNRALGIRQQVARPEPPGPGLQTLRDAAGLLLGAGQTALGSTLLLIGAAGNGLAGLAKRKPR